MNFEATHEFGGMELMFYATDAESGRGVFYDAIGQEYHLPWREVTSVQPLPQPGETWFWLGLGVCLVDDQGNLRTPNGIVAKHARWVEVAPGRGHRLLDARGNSPELEHALDLIRRVLNDFDRDGLPHYQEMVRTLLDRGFSQNEAGDFFDPLEGE